LQATVAPLLVFFGFGAFGAVIGYTIASVGASSISFVFLYFSILRKLPHSSIDKSEFFQTLKPLLKYGIPLAIGAIIGGIATQFYSFQMASFVRNVDVIGNYKTSLNFSVLLTFFTLPITTVLFPAFAKIDKRNEHQLLKTAFTSSAKYAAFLLTPAILAMVVLAQPLIGTLYGSKWIYASTFLAVGALSNLLILFGILSVGGLFAAVGETKLIMEMNLVSLFIGVPMGFLLIPPFGIIGLLIIPFISSAPSLFVGLHLAKKRYGVRLDYFASARILFASVFAAFTTYLMLSTLIASDWLKLFIGSIVFLTVFLSTAPLINAINQTEINNLRAMFSGTGVISRLIEIPLLYMEKLTRIFDLYARRNVRRSKAFPARSSA
jgi:O-antigen/teichoic acid export membrane protein